MASFDAIRVHEDELHDLILFADHSSLVAWRHRVVWTAGGLVTDDLKVDRITQGAIRCSGWDVSRVELSLDPATGEVLA